MKKKQEYINNRQLYEAIVEYKKNIAEAAKNGKEKPRIPPYIGRAIYEIAQRLATKPNFASYSYIDEMISDAYENCILYFDAFNPEKGSNPFAYFTQIIKQAFIRRIAKEKRQRYVIYKHFDTYMLNTDQANYLRDDDNNLLYEPVYDNIQQYIQDYEQKEAEKKLKKQEAKGLEKLYDTDTDKDKKV